MCGFGFRRRDEENLDGPARPIKNPPDVTETPSSAVLEATPEAPPEAPPLLRVSTDISPPANPLCDTCKLLNLSPRRFVVLPGDKEWNKPNQPDDLSISFGNVSDIKEKKFCPLCRLVLHALGGARVPSFEDGEPVHVDLSWNTDGPRPDASAPWSHVPEIRTLRPYARKLSGGFIQSESLNLFPEITLLADDSPIPSATYFVRPIGAEQIDFSLARKWLSNCESHHDKTCQEAVAIQEMGRSHPADEIPDFRCLDVEQNCLVKVPSGSRYAALSYVWGRQKFFTTMMANVADLERAGSLEELEYLKQIPQTIKDAMQVAREVGIRYLWVDSLCIVQDDNTGKKLDTIKKMDLVYSAAHLVVVAASSADAYAGIAGIHPGTRGVRQPIEEIEPGFRLAFKTRWQDYIEDAVYYTRGWTFQETHFATRSLIFIGGQVVFSCKSVSEWQEHVFETEDEIKGKSEKEGSGVGPFEGDDIGNYEGLIQTFSERVLSFDSDVYNAFAGVATQLCFRLKTDLCHGIPTAYFDWFLLWGPLSNQVRRPNAPSWSWAGWVGGSFPRIWDWYNRSIRRVQKAIRKRTWVIWYHRLSHDSTQCFLVHTHDKASESSKKKLNFYGAKSHRRFGDLDCSRTEPTERTLKIHAPTPAPTYTTDILSKRAGSGFLQFWTVSLTLRVDEPTSTAEDVGPAHTQRRLGIFGRSGHELGTVSVQGDWAKKNPVPAEREFILLCEGRDERAEGGRIDDEEGWRYMAMLIDWHGEYAERVAIGSIGKGDLKEALGDGAVWKEIILG